MSDFSLTKGVLVQDLVGLWERSLIAWPDGREDTTTFVAWLQGVKLFADLRQPIDPPAFDSVARLDDLHRIHFAWLARQEGFAGHFVATENAFEWQRSIDFQCPTDVADAGYLTFSGDVLIERGRDQPYVEHWHRRIPSAPLYTSVHMQDAQGREGFLVRVGDDFMYVRDRLLKLPLGGSLSKLINESSDLEARAMLDCEISLGRVQDGTWTIARSTLPFRIDNDLSPNISNDQRTLMISDVVQGGSPLRQCWTILEFNTNDANFCTPSSRRHPTP